MKMIMILKGNHGTMQQTDHLNGLAMVKAIHYSNSLILPVEIKLEVIQQVHHIINPKVAFITLMGRDMSLIK